MKKILSERKEGQNGEIMLETSIIFVSVITILFVLLSLSFMFYEEAMMTSIASEMASDVGRNFKYTELKIGTDTISSGDAESAAMFRMSFGKGKLEDKHAERADAYLKWRVPLATLGFSSDVGESNCDIYFSGIGRAYVKVTVTRETDFFLSGILEFAGVLDDNEIEFSSVAYAEVSDLMAYTSTVGFTEYFSKKMEAFNAIGTLYVNVEACVETMVEFIQTMLSVG